MFVNETKNDVETNLSATLHTGGPIMAGACGGFAAFFAVLGAVLFGAESGRLLLCVLFLRRRRSFSSSSSVCYKPVFEGGLKKVARGQRGGAPLCLP